MKRITLSTAALFFMVLGMFGQSETMTKFQEENEKGGYNLFLYQSVIRMLNKDNNDDFNYLIDDLEYVKVIITDSTGVDAENQFDNLISSIKTEGFTELLMIDNKDLRASIFEKEKGRDGEAEFVAFLYAVPFGRTGAFEMNGQLDLKYISAFESLDFGKLKTIAEDQY